MPLASPLEPVDRFSRNRNLKPLKITSTDLIPQISKNNMAGKQSFEAVVTVALPPLEPSNDGNGTWNIGLVIL